MSNIIDDIDNAICITKKDFIKFSQKKKNDVDENEEMYNKFSKIVENDFLPAILIGKNAFVPDRSFNTINEAVDLIKSHLQVL